MKEMLAKGNSAQTKEKNTYILSQRKYKKIHKCNST
jgi:hypothetical protein